MSLGLKCFAGSQVSFMMDEQISKFIELSTEKMQEITDNALPGKQKSHKERNENIQRYLCFAGSQVSFTMDEQINQFIELSTEKCKESRTMPSQENKKGIKTGMRIFNGTYPLSFS